MKKFKDGTILTKEFKDMTSMELYRVDITTFEEGEFDEWLKWLNIKEEEELAPMYY